MVTIIWQSYPKYLQPVTVYNNNRVNLCSSCFLSKHAEGMKSTSLGRKKSGSQVYSILHCGSKRIFIPTESHRTFLGDEGLKRQLIFKGEHFQRGGFHLVGMHISWNTSVFVHFSSDGSCY